LRATASACLTYDARFAKVGSMLEDVGWALMIWGLIAAFVGILVYETARVLFL
jgi:hypothetical protein